MRAAWYEENGGPDVLRVGQLPDPAVGPDTVLIRVEAISIEGGDLLNRQFSPPREVPFVPGYQAAGRVEAIGERVTRFAPGDRVVGFNWNGSHAELFAVPEHHAYAVPDGLDLDLAATVPVAFGTASDCLFEFGRVKPGETVLVQGAAGGVGLAAVQLAAQAGATVIGTASGAERLARIAPYGMHHGIDHRSEDIAARCRETTGGKGADIILDMAGGQSVEALIDAARPRARYAVVGAAAGALPSFGFFPLIRKSLTVFGISFGRDMATPRAHRLIDSLLRRMAEGRLVMPIDRSFALSEVQAAHRHVAEAHPFGRVLMRP